jgi:polyisoprenoid-binding protein YceI
MMITTVKGRFTDVKGEIRMDETHPDRSSVQAELGVASITTGVEQRDAHLRSADFFEAERYPAIHFRSTRIARAGGDQFTVTGDLTIRGTTRPVTLTVESGGRGKDPWGGERLGFSMATTINRKDFGLHWNQALEAGGVVVGNEVKISVDLQLVRSSE